MNITKSKLKKLTTLPAAALDRDISLEPSVSHQVTLGLTPLPNGAKHIKDVKPGVLCVNLERRAYVGRSCGPIGDREDHYKFEAWDKDLGEWLNVTVLSTYPLQEDISKVDRSIMPPDPKVELAKQRSRAAHLPKFKREKPIPEIAKRNGKSVFKGKLGRGVFLLDAGDGSTVGEITEGTAKEAAHKLNRRLISQDGVTPYAYYVFTEAWKQARAELKVTSKGG